MCIQEKFKTMVIFSHNYGSSEGLEVLVIH